MVIKSFSHSTMAHIYLNRLTEEGVVAILDNDIIGTVLPYPSIDIKLKVSNKHLEYAMAIINRIDEEVNNLHLHDFSEADEKEIEFEKRLYESKRVQKGGGIVFFLILTIFFALLIILFIK